MKAFIIFALALSVSYPALADQLPNQSLEIQNDSTGIENLSSQDMLEFYNLQDETADTEVAPDDEKAFYRCYARPNAFWYRRYRYYGNGFNRRWAAIRANRACIYNLRRMNFFASRYGCRVYYCLRFFK